VSFASTLFYWPLWGCIFKRAGFVHRETVNRISSLHFNMFACGTWRRWRLIVAVLHVVHFVKVDELHNWIYVIDLILMHWLLYSELWCYLLIQGIAHLHRSFTFSKRWGATIHAKSSTSAMVSFLKVIFFECLLDLCVTYILMRTCVLD
jgi:hypothetical protein